MLILFQNTPYRYTNMRKVLNSVGVQVSVEELKSLLSKYSNTESLAQSGVTVAAKKYMFLSSTDRVVRARKGTSGVHCIKTVQGDREHGRRI
jgi:hypothetical protein